MPEEKMIILLYGEDTYSSRKKMGEVMEEHKKKHKSGLNLRYLEGKNVSFDDLRNEMLGASMFKEKKLIVLLDAFSNSKLKEDLIEKGEVFADSDNVLLLFERQDVPKKEKLLSFIEKHGKLQEFSFLEGKLLKDWIREEFKRLNATADEGAIEMLADFVGGDLWQISNEVAKLANYNPRGVTGKDVKLLVRPKSETNVFDTMDAIALKDKKRAFDLLKSHMEKGDSAIYLLSMIASQIRNIISVKGGGKIAMHPYVMRKSMQQAKNFSLEDLKRIYARIVELDSDIKVGRVDQGIALDVLISEI